MDGSRRSAHGNAYFTGLGRAKRIVFFDTLVERLQPAEIEAVLAHELGHFKLKHIAKRLGVFLPGEPGRFWRCWAGWPSGPGSTPASASRRRWTAATREWRWCCSCSCCQCSLLSFAPLASYLSRRHEFEADAFAARYASAQDLVNGAGQALRGQRLDSDTRSDPLGVLRLASAGIRCALSGWSPDLPLELMTLRHDSSRSIAGRSTPRRPLERTSLPRHCASFPAGKSKARRSRGPTASRITSRRLPSSMPWHSWCIARTIIPTSVLATTAAPSVFRPTRQTASRKMT